MKKAYIWDLDGTLLDSYHVIVESLRLAVHAFGADYSPDQIRRFTITYSSSELIQKVAREQGVKAEQIIEKYAEFSFAKYRDIILMDNAAEILERLSQLGAEHYVYTHRGRTTIPVLQNLRIDGYFQEIITSKSGFARKPAPDGLHYLMEKYGLEPANTCYVGDRSLDMECARNAGVDGILYLPEHSVGAPTGAETYIVKDLLEILNIK